MKLLAADLEEADPAVYDILQKVRLAYEFFTYSRSGGGFADE